MKTSIIVGLFVFILSFPTYSQDIFIYSKNGTKEYFERIDSIVQIKFKDRVSEIERLAIAQSINSPLSHDFTLNPHDIVEKSCKTIQKNALQLWYVHLNWCCTTILI